MSFKTDYDDLARRLSDVWNAIPVPRDFESPSVLLEAKESVSVFSGKHFAQVDIESDVFNQTFAILHMEPDVRFYYYGSYLLLFCNYCKRELDENGETSELSPAYVSHSLILLAFKILWYEELPEDQRDVLAEFAVEMLKVGFDGDHETIPLLRQIADEHRRAGDSTA